MIKLKTIPFYTAIAFLFLLGCSSSKEISKTKGNIMSADEKAIRQTISDYFDLMNQKNVEESIEFMHPKLFELVPKELFVETFNSLFSDSTMTFSFDSISVQSVVGPVLHETTKYAKVNYLGYMGMTIHDETDELLHSMMDSAMKLQFGKDNVTFDKAKNRYDIKKDSEMIAIRGQDDGRWYIMENNKEYKGLFDMLVPEEVVEKLRL